MSIPSRTLCLRILAICATSTAFSAAPRGLARRRSYAAMSAFDPSKYYSHGTDAETKDYVMQQTMVRVKDPDASLKFYCEVLCFHLVMHRDFPQWGFSCATAPAYRRCLGRSAELLPWPQRLLRGTRRRLVDPWHPRGAVDLLVRAGPSTPCRHREAYTHAHVGLPSPAR